MAKAGRKRKAGARTKSGALKRVPLRDVGCPGVQRRRDLYAAPPVFANDDDGQRRRIREADASQTFDAIGRAWSAGLLGYRGDELRDGARKIAAQYWRAYGFITPDSLARFQPCTGAPALLDSDREKIIEAALRDTLSTVAKCGRDHRRAFDHLVIDMHPDAGPAWLDRAIFAKRQGRAASEADGLMLRLAVEALEKVA